MHDNLLKFNNAKTEFIMFDISHDLKKVKEWTLSAGHEAVVPSTTFHNIGSMLDSTNLTMESHINSVRKSSYFQIRILANIRNYLAEEAAKSLAHAVVILRLDNMSHKLNLDHSANS